VSLNLVVWPAPTKLSVEQAGSVGVTTGVGVGVDFGVTSGAGLTTDVCVFFTKDVNEGPFKSNNPGNQYLQRSFVSAGTSIATHG